MSDDPSKIYSLEEAKDRIDAFQHQLEELLQAYGFHSVFGVVSLQQGASHFVRFGSILRGCSGCMAHTVARAIAFSMTRADVDLCLRSLQEFLEERRLASREESHAESQAEQLRSLSVPVDAEGKPWKN